jgi:hypothetical protein
LDNHDKAKAMKSVMEDILGVEDLDELDTEYLDKQRKLAKDALECSASGDDKGFQKNLLKLNTSIIENSNNPPIEKK